jgi:peroxiredoxin
MAQLRQDYRKFTERDTEVAAVGPEDYESFGAYWHEHGMPFPGLADPRHEVADLYSQRVAFLTGRMPSMFIIDKNGKIRYVHHGESMSDIESDENVLALLDKLNAETD